MKVQKNRTFREDRLGLFQTLPPKVFNWYKSNNKRVTMRHAVYNVTQDETKPDQYKRTVNLSYLRKIRKKDPPIEVCDKCEKDPCECIEEVCVLCKQNPCECKDFCGMCESDPCICHICPDFIYITDIHIIFISI